MTPDRAIVLSWLRGGQPGIDQWHAFISKQNSSALVPSLAPAMGSIVPEVDLSGADLSGLDLRNVRFWRTWCNETNFRGTKLDGTSFGDAMLRGADFSKASLRGASLDGVDLWGAKLCNADLSDAFLQRARCFQTDFSGATIERANLTLASLVDANLERANVSACSVYGMSAWNLKLTDATQKDLVISKPNEPATLTADSLEVAQFLYLLLRNERIRHVIETITSKVVLILGRFTAERKAVLDAIREELRRQNCCPVMFDFEKPESRSFVETVSTLAHMAKFIIADFTDPKIVLQEVQHVVPNLAVPVLPLVQRDSGHEPTTLADLRRGRTYILATHRYCDAAELLRSLPVLIEQANANAAELAAAT